MAKEIPAEVIEEILSLIRDGQKLMAVKRYKECRDVSLMEAKTFIEQLTADLGKLPENEESGLDASSELHALIYAGQKIAAVKRYMDMHGVTLANAKHSVEQITDQLKRSSPERFSKASAGCVGALLLISTLAFTGLFCALRVINSQ